MALRIIGISDEVTTCECCGRTNLKKTVVLTDGEGEKRYGSECAAKAMRKSGDKFASKAWVEKVSREIARRPNAPARDSFGVLNVATGRVVTTCSTREIAEQAVASRGSGYEVVGV